MKISFFATSLYLSPRGEIRRGLNERLPFSPAGGLTLECVSVLAVTDGERVRDGNKGGSAAAGIRGTEGKVKQRSAL